MEENVQQTMPGHTEQAHKTSLPQLDPASYPSQLFWLTVTFVALYLLVARSILPRIHDVLEKRQHHLTQDIDRAEAYSRDAEEARAAYEKLQADARGKAQQLITEAQAAITAMQEKKFAEVDADLNNRLSKARVAIEERKAELKEKLAPVTQEVTAQVIEKLIGIAPSQQQLDSSTSASSKATPKKRQVG